MSSSHSKSNDGAYTILIHLTRKLRYLIYSKMEFAEREKISQTSREAREYFKQIAETTHRQSFHHFTSLPRELRFLVYSKMTIGELIPISRTTTEARSYLQRIKPIAVERIWIYASEIRGKATISVKYGDKFIERFTLPTEVARLLNVELSNYRGCWCFWCETCWEDFTDDDLCDEKEKENMRERGHQLTNFGIPEFLHQWTSMEQVMYALQFFSPEEIYIRTYAYGGFLETLIPPTPLRAKKALVIYWHLKEEDGAPSLNVPMWNKWLGNVRTVAFYTSDFWTDIDFVVHNDIFKIKAVRNARRMVYIRGTFVITEDQKRSLKGRLKSKPDPLKYSYYDRKIKEWIEEPRVHFKTTLGKVNMRIEKLLKQSVESLVQPNFLVYPNYCPIRRKYRHRTKRCLAIRNLETNTALVITKNSMETIGIRKPLNPEDWPY